MFLMKPRADAGDDRSPWGDFWFESVGARSMSGIRINADAAMRLTAVYSSVRVLAETMAILPFILYKNKTGGGKTIIKDHWLYNLIAKKPNRYQNAFEWREMMAGHLALRGNGYNQIIDNGRGVITELMPIHPDRIRPEMVSNVFTNFYLVYEPNGAQTRIPRGEIFHLRGLSSNGLTGLNPIELARDSLGIGLAAQEFGGRFFQNDARPLGGWIEWDKNFKTSEDRKTWQATWQEGQGGKNRGKTAVLTQGMKYHEIGLTNKDSQFIETRQFSVTDIARIFRVPPHLIGDLTRSTNNNIEQQSLEFVTFTMTPWAERWEASIEDQLLPPGEDFELEFDFANLLRGDSVARTQFYTGGINSGWLTRNEVRMRENLDPLPGLSEPLQPLNMVDAGSVPPPAPGAPRAPTPDPAPDPEEEDGDEKKAAATAARLAALQFVTAVRVIRKEKLALKNVKSLAEREAFFSKHAEFVADALAVDQPTAEIWCAYRLRAMTWDDGVEDASTHHDADINKLAENLIAKVCVVQTSAQKGPK